MYLQFNSKFKLSNPELAMSPTNRISSFLIQNWSPGYVCMWLYNKNSIAFPISDSMAEEGDT